MNPLLLVLFGIAAIIVSAAIFWRPAFGAALILAVVHFERALIFNGISLVKMLSILCLGLLIVRILATGKGIRIDRTTILIALFLLWVSITVFWNREQSGTLSELTSLVLQSFMYFLIINLIGSKDDLKLALWGHVIGGTALAFILANTMVSQNLLRDTEIAGSGLNLAARMVGLNLLIAILLSQLVENRLAKLLLVGMAILSGISSLLSLSRGAWYALVLSMLAIIIILGIKGRYQFTFKQFFLIAIIGSITLYAANTFLLTEHGSSKLEDRFETAYTFSDGASGRFGIWVTALDVFVEKPLLGHGFNSFERLNAWKPDGGAHNAFVLIAVENGLIGLSFFLLILASVFLRLLNLLINENTSVTALGWGMALFVFLGIGSMVDTSVDRKYLWFVLGLISLLVHYYGTKQSMESGAQEIEAVSSVGAANQPV